MQQSAYIPGPLPGLNELVAARARWGRGAKKRWNGYSALKREWQALIAAACRRDGLKPAPPSASVLFAFVWAEKAKRRDPDNFTGGGRKLILDSLRKLGIIKNDGWAQVAGWQDKWYVDPKRPGVTVVMEWEDR